MYLYDHWVVLIVHRIDYTRIHGFRLCSNSDAEGDIAMQGWVARGEEFGFVVMRDQVQFVEYGSK